MPETEINVGQVWRLNTIDGTATIRISAVHPWPSHVRRPPNWRGRRLAPTNSHSWERPSREELLAEGRKQARIHGVDPEHACLYAQGWAAAMGRADRALDEMEREMLKVTRTADFNAGLVYKGQIARLEKRITRLENAIANLTPDGGDAILAAIDAAEVQK